MRAALAAPSPPPGCSVQPASLLHFHASAPAGAGLAEEDAAAERGAEVEWKRDTRRRDEADDLERRDEAGLGNAADQLVGAVDDEDLAAFPFVACERTAVPDGDVQPRR